MKLRHESAAGAAPPVSSAARDTALMCHILLRQDFNYVKKIHADDNETLAFSRQLFYIRQRPSSPEVLEHAYVCMDGFRYVCKDGWIDVISRYVCIYVYKCMYRVVIPILFVALDIWLFLAVEPFEGESIAYFTELAYLVGEDEFYYFVCQYETQNQMIAFQVQRLNTL